MCEVVLTVSPCEYKALIHAYYVSIVSSFLVHANLLLIILDLALLTHHVQS